MLGLKEKSKPQETTKASPEAAVPRVLDHERVMVERDKLTKIQIEEPRLRQKRDAMIASRNQQHDPAVKRANAILAGLSKEESDRAATEDEVAAIHREHEAHVEAIRMQRLVIEEVEAAVGRELAEQVGQTYLVALHDIHRAIRPLRDAVLAEAKLRDEIRCSIPNAFSYIRAMDIRHIGSGDDPVGGLDAWLREAEIHYKIAPGCDVSQTAARTAGLSY